MKWEIYAGLLKSSFGELINFDCGINYPSNKISRFYEQVALMSFNPPLRLTNTMSEKLYRKIVVNSNYWILIKIGVIYNKLKWRKLQWNRITISYGPYRYLPVQHTRGWQHLMPCPGDGIPGFSKSRLPVKSIRPLFGFMAFWGSLVVKLTYLCWSDAFVLILRVVLIWLIWDELTAFLKYNFYFKNLNFFNLKP